MPKAPQEVADRAKALKIKSWWSKSEETLLEEIAEVTTNMDTPDELPESDFVHETPFAPTPPKSTPKKEPEGIDLVDLMQGITWDQAMISIKCLDSKSPFWPHRALIEKKLNGN